MACPSCHEDCGGTFTCAWCQREVGWCAGGSDLDPVLAESCARCWCRIRERIEAGRETWSRRFSEKYADALSRVRSDQPVSVSPDETPRGRFAPSCSGGAS
jgi:hypothetical protein